MKKIIYAGLARSDKEIEDYIDAWCKLYSDTKKCQHDPSEYDREMQEKFFIFSYYHLDIIDGKTGALLQFNAIVVAVYSIFLVSFIEKTATMTIGNGLFFKLGIVYSIVGMIMSLQGIWIHWSSTEDFLDSERHVKNLVCVINGRTISYRRSWTYSIVGFSLMLIYPLNALFIEDAKLLSWLLNYPVEIFGSTVSIEEILCLKIFLDTIIWCYIWDFIALKFEKK